MAADTNSEQPQSPERQKRTMSHESRVDRLSSRLYHKDHVTAEHQRHALSSHEQSVPHTWMTQGSKNKAPRKGRNPMRTIFFIALSFFVLSGMYLGFSLTRGSVSVSSENIELNISAKTFVDGGEDIDFRVEIVNGNTVPLALADLVIEYPTSATVDEDTGRGTERIRRPIGDIAARQSQEQEFDIALYGQEGDERDITARLEYRIPGSNSIFIKSETFRVGIRSAPVTLTLDAPDRIVNNQDITLDIGILSNTLTPITDTLVQVEYPSGFQFVSADPEPSLGSNIWRLGDLQPNDDRGIIIEGFLSGEAGAQRTFTAFVGQQDQRDDRSLGTIYSSTSHVTAMEAPFVGIRLSVNKDDAETVAVNEDEGASAVIEWFNSLPTRLTDLRITASLDGTVFDQSSIRVTEGFYDSNTQTVSWNADTNSDFAQVEPGQQGVASFGFGLNPLVNTGSSTVTTSPEMSIDIGVRATGADGTIYTAEKVDTIRLVVNSSATLTQETLFASGPFPSAGAMPPRVGAPTTYTLHWDIRNSANTLENARVVTTLPPTVTWLDQTSPNSENLVFNTESRSLTWDIGDIPASAGFGDVPSKEVYFQVAVTPSTSQVGQRITLANEIVFMATDTFTDETVRTTKREHNNQLVGDSIENNGVVLQGN